MPECYVDILVNKAHFCRDTQALKITNGTLLIPSSEEDTVADLNISDLRVDCTEEILDPVSSFIGTSDTAPATEISKDFCDGSPIAGVLHAMVAMDTCP